MRTILNRWVGVGVGLGVLAAGATVGCSSDSEASDGPHIVVTTNILGDVVSEVATDSGAEIEVIMPLGSDPHEFAASTKQAEAMVDADLLVINGAGFEEGMAEIIERAEDAGTPIFAFADHVDLLPFAGEGDDHTDDPHIWTDPTRIAEALPSLGDALGEVDGVDAASVDAGVAAYGAELAQLDQDITASVAAIPALRRVLVTNHEVFGYFADRYGFEVVGTVIPSGTTLAEPSSAELEDLADVIKAQGVPAIFGETTQSTRLAGALAESVGNDVSVVELYTESLGASGTGAETYVGLMRTDADLISGALT